MKHRTPELRNIRQRLQETKQRFFQAEKQLRQTGEQLQTLLKKESQLLKKENLLLKKEYLQKNHERFRQRQSTRKLNRKIRRQMRKSRGHWYTRGRLLPLLQHLLPLLLLAFALPSFGQTALPASSQSTLPSFAQSVAEAIPTQSLYANIDAFAFFHDNEYDSRIQKGYSLPGIRLTPRLAYRPLEMIQIEAGASLLFFNGANKYPCYAYHDIGTWKGEQYQRGAHALPWVRFQANFRHVNVVMGNIYGGTLHGLSAPLFNAEQDMSADPETGVQILVKRPHFQSDTWLNWQSYIFELDSHQEAFTVGESMRLRWGKGVEWFVPLQLTIQHRGGEQDTTSLGVQTLSNAALGFGATYRPFAPLVLQEITAQVAAVASYQQAGKLWPFDTGFALHASADARLLRSFTLAADYLYAPRQFVSLFGNPFFSTISLRDPAQSYQKQHVFRLAAGYEYTFARGYSLGAKAELFCLHAKPDLQEQDFSFGIYFRCSPRFLLKKFGAEKD